MSQGYRTRDSLSQIFVDIEREADQLRNVQLEAPAHRPVPKWYERIRVLVYAVALATVIAMVLP